MMGAPGKFQAGKTGSFIEAVGDSGNKFLICVIASGKSKNRVNYPAQVLREAAPHFEDVRVFVKSDDEHIKGKGKDVRNLVGILTNARFVESAAGGEIQAVLEVLNSSDVAEQLREAVERNIADKLFGFSIDAIGRSKKRIRYREALSIDEVESVDLIIEAGAGGKIIRLIEAANNSSNNSIENPAEDADVALRDRMIEAVKTANKGVLPEGLDIDSDNALETAYREAVAITATAQADNTLQDADTTVASVSHEELNETVRMVEARSSMRVAIAESHLPDVSKNKLRKHFSDLDVFREADVAAAIKDESDYLSHFTESGHVAGMGARVESGEDRSEKVRNMLDAFFDKDDASVNSFRECYQDITGDTKVTGHLQHCDPVRLREAAGESAFREAVDSSTFSNVLGDAIHRSLGADYNNPQSMYSVYRHLVNIVPANDFRTKELTRIGGYGDLPAVSESGNYPALTTPSDEKASYAVSKRGGLESVSLETIKNDDVGVLRRIPTKLSRAAQRTLAKFVLDFVKNNPVIYDGQSLFHASHNNLGTAALSAASLAVARLAMMKQTEPGSSERLGIPPVHLWVPADLEETAFDLFRRTTNNDEDFVESMQMAVHPVWYWDDADDWAVTADVDEIPFIELSFLDGNEAPEIFVQDSPTQGSLFSNDVLKYKIRHIYGGTPEDYRGGYKSVVP